MIELSSTDGILMLCKWRDGNSQLAFTFSTTDSELVVLAFGCVMNVSENQLEIEGRESHLVADLHDCKFSHYDEKDLRKETVDGVSKSRCCLELVLKSGQKLRLLEHSKPRLV